MGSGRSERDGLRDVKRETSDKGGCGFGDFSLEKKVGGGNCPKICPELFDQSDK